MKRLLNHLSILGIITTLLLTPLTAVGIASAEPLGTVTRYTTPTSGSQPYDITTGPDGNMWFTENSKARIARSTLTGTITEYLLPSGYTYPTHIISGPNGAVWFVARGGSNLHALGEIDTNNGNLVMHDLPAPVGVPDGGGSGYSASTYDPTDLVFAGGYLWFSWHSNSPYVVKIDQLGQADQIKIHTPLAEDGVPQFGYIPDHLTLKSYRAGPVAYDTYENDGVLFMNYLGNTNDPSTKFIEKIHFDGNRSYIPIGETISTRMVIDRAGTFWFGGGNPGDGVRYLARNGDRDEIQVSADQRDYAKDIEFGPDGALWVTINRTPNQGSGNTIVRLDTATSAFSTWTISSGSSRPRGIVVGPDMNMWFAEASAHKVSRIGTGASITDDIDGDGLSVVSEFAQGTLDTDSDTDNDGLSDYVESPQFMGRDATFCNQVTSYCEYPHPLHKDLYIEVDWMVEPGTGGLDMQPASSHVAQIEIALSDQGIRPHVDVGQLGGGNEVPYYSNVNFEPDTNNDHDFYDFKNGNVILGSQFDSANRYGIWRYQLLVPFSENNTSLGGQAYPGDDDSIIAYESLLNRAANDGIDFDLLLPRTMLHELGHNLCLTNGDSTYTGQSASCVFAGIDQAFSSDYVSAMNYNQQELVDYSHGHNGSEDHDDWAAVMSGIDDFAYQELGEGVAHSRMGSTNLKKDPGRILKDPYAKKSPNNYRKPVRD